MNKEQFKGNWNQLKGEIKRKWGKFTDDELLEVEGDYDKFEGKAQELYGDKKEEITEWLDGLETKNRKTVSREETKV